jgi:excisionase family DNA binding protein
MAEDEKINRETQAPDPFGNPDYETKAQVARRLAVSQRTIEAMVHDKRIPYVRFTSKILRFPKRDVDAYIHKHLRVGAVGETNAERFG